MSEKNSTLSTYQWCNATYVDFAIGDSFEFLGKTVTLLRLENQFAVVRVGETEERLVRIERNLPSVVEGVRVFLADNRNVKSLSTDPEVHGLLQKDAVLCLSDPSKPLLDPDRYTFPISRVDGYNWHMEESSGIFSYYGEPWRPREDMDYFRSHEGIDFNLHDGRGVEKHPQVAIEDGVVCWARDTNKDEACVVLQSASEPNIYYIYQHLCNRLLYVKDGQTLKKGDIIGYNWGDGVWGHLHFAVVHRDTVPEWNGRYTNTFNFFPQMYELWHGDLEPRHQIWTEGDFTFAHDKAPVENKLHVAAYNDINGYGWKIVDWCTAGAMQRHPQNSGSIAFKKVLHEGHPAEARNPEDYYDFQVNVQPGSYAVSVEIGDVLVPTWQRVSFNDVDAGVVELGANEFEWTQEQTVKAPDGRLIVRIHLRDEQTAAGISQLRFRRVGD